VTIADVAVTVTDVLRLIGHDERCHKLCSVAAAAAERGLALDDPIGSRDEWLDAAARAHDLRTGDLRSQCGETVRRGRDPLVRRRATRRCA
jgi:hypothetical protein